MITYFASGSIAGDKQPYYLRRLDYLNSLQWDDETEYLAVYVNGVEVEFDFYSNGSIIHLIHQPAIGDKIELIVEPIQFLED